MAGSWPNAFRMTFSLREELRANVREAVTGYFFDQPKPSAVRLHLVRDEVLAVG